MNSKGKYGKYLQILENCVGLILLNLAFLIASIFDENIVGFRWKVTWLIVNLSYMPVIMIMQRTPLQRSAHADQVILWSLKAVAVQAVVFFTILAFLGSWVHNISFYIWFYGLMFTLLPLGWMLTRQAVKFYRRRGHNYSAAIIVGTSSTAIRLRDEMLSDPGYGYKFMGFFSATSGTQPNEITEYRGTIDDIEAFVNSHEVREIYYTLPGDDVDTMHRVMQIADRHVLQFYFVPSQNPYVGRRPKLRNIGQISILDIRSNPLQELANRYIKRAFDLLFSSVALICSPIIFVPVAVAIKISSPGPIFFKQKRTGYLGQEFNCWKFRTMRVNDKANSRQATRDDSRVTAVGRFLRHTSIDELPQFINVWLGDMSVVGPRPHMVKHTDDYSSIIDKYMVRHFIKPGITGWAQINGFRGQTEELWQMERRVQYDIWYIEHWNFILDLKIIVMTLVNAFRGEENAF